MHLLYTYVVALGKAQYGHTPFLSSYVATLLSCVLMAVPHLEAHSPCPTLLSSLLQENSEACKAVKCW